MTKTVVATSRPSGDRRVLLGMPANGVVERTLHVSSSSRLSNFVTTPRSATKQDTSPVTASTRSHGTPVKARGPAGSSSDTMATVPY